MTNIIVNTYDMICYVCINSPYILMSPNSTDAILASQWFQIWDIKLNVLTPAVTFKKNIIMF